MLPQPPQPPQLPQSRQVFDRQQVALRRTRALARVAARPLWQHLADNLVERRRLILRDFVTVGQIGGLVQPFDDVDVYLDWRVARANVQKKGEKNGRKKWVLADDETLPLANEAFDLLVGLAHLHTVNDVPGTLIQMRQALRPDGCLLGGMLGQDSLPQLREVLLRVDSQRLGGAALRLAPLIDIRDMGMLLLRAGFALPVADLEEVTVIYPDWPSLVRDLRASALTACHTQRDFRYLGRGYWREVADVYQKLFGDDAGRLPVTYNLLWYLAWAPGPHQPKPLRPGSAKASLVDTLEALKDPSIQPPPKTRAPS